ncbi:S1 RNA-binding domain-containing protein [Enterococcus sp. BWB1-3]|nr:CvfD/Ygs/GSP13 family RNA-binding post-transcriptional regulator [Enterococcus sp. BWB1-3]MBL1228955.1 S1 RNA-binding domain-containing protein [Enterococcus sp. BWB1-3]
MTIDGTVTGIQPYGAFVSLDRKTQGLIHVSEIQVGYTKNIHGVLDVGDKIQVQVIDIDEYSQKISLSLRTLKNEMLQAGYRRKKYFTNKNKKIGFTTLEKKLPKWIDEAMDELLIK